MDRLTNKVSAMKMIDIKKKVNKKSVGSRIFKHQSGAAFKSSVKY
jgi:hypothetical protein